MRPRTGTPIDPPVTAAAGQNDALWYKDAVLYQVHVRGFSDSSGDGVGDFNGLARKLDYIQALGVSAIWVQPFYPSPLRDDGYDIARYEGVHPSYGTMRDFRAFLDAAHARGLKVVTELVINHTSDQHPWFQAARRAKPGTSKRNFYVWSDTPERYAGVPIVFKDVERSNWTWDPVAGAYFWHRFFHHQPDLNFDNPMVQKAVLRVMRFWLDMGVDGMRLDAVPYLVERDGTQCANLPETHAILRTIRRELDERYTGRMLLAEANQWPADVRSYFGEGDECHMAFHFPLMPRLYMALRQEDRHPLSEILYQTPEIPDSCQWALFLRNHDELTLEMVSDEERDYMYQTYASDPEMRLNAGIRRRLAPLLENHRARIELLHGLLLSLPGTPVIYYGDEIGMGDNVYLGDRNGVRTPMQWSADRNGGFSSADAAKLYAPPITDPVYGYQAVNVEAQERSPHSLLNWMRHLIALRRQHAAFGRGTLDLLRPLNRAIFAFIRRYGSEDPILVVANLSRTVQGVWLDLGSLAGLVPVEMSGRVELPRISDAPYFLTLGPYAFMWLALKRESPMAAATSAPIPVEAEGALPPLLVGPEWERMLDGSVRHLLERRYLPTFLAQQPWLRPRLSTELSVDIIDWSTMASGEEPGFLTILAVRGPAGLDERYVLPLTIAPGEAGEQVRRLTPEAVVARVAGARKGVLHARLDGASGRQLVATMLSDTPPRMHRGRLSIVRLGGFDQLGLPASVHELPPAPGDFKRFHSAVALGERVMLSIPRRLWPGPAPSQQLADLLRADGRFARAPLSVARLDYVERDGISSPIALLDAFVPHQADGWRHICGELDRFADLALTLPLPPDVPRNPAAWWCLALPDIATQLMASSLRTAEVLGRRIGELHGVLARHRIDHAGHLHETPSPDEEPLGDQLARAWAQVQTRVVAAEAGDLAGTVSDRVRMIVEGAADHMSVAQVSHVHGRLDLSHVLIYENDFTIIGFANDRRLAPADRLRLQSPMTDVASMLLSLRAAADTTVAARADTAGHPDRLSGWILGWTAWFGASLLAGYRAGRAEHDDSLVPEDASQACALLQLFVVRQALESVRDAATTRTVTAAALTALDAVTELPGC